MITNYFIDIVILLLAAAVFVPLFRILKLGSVTGFIIGGVVVGPSGLGLIKNINEITTFAEIGVVLLLFFIGIELKVTRLLQIKNLVFGLGLLQVVITGVVLASIAYMLFGVSIKAAIIIGPALALSSTAFVMQLLIEQKKFISEYGQASFAILLLQDLAVVPLLALVPLLTIEEFSIGFDIGLALVESVFIISLVVVIGRYLLHPILHRIAILKDTELFTISAVLIIIGSAMITEHAGFSMAMGAFLAGILMSDSFYRLQIKAELRPFRGLFLGLFFMSMGMFLNIKLLSVNPLPILSLVALLIIIKVFVLYLITYWFKFKNKNHIAISLILAQSGEFALAVFALAFQNNILDKELFQQLLLIVLLSMLLTPILAYYANKLADIKNINDKKSSEKISIKEPIVIIGFGRVGHRIGEMLKTADKPFLAIDSNAKTVKKFHNKGYKIFYGNINNLDILKNIQDKGVKIVIVTINNPKDTKNVVSELRKNCQELIIYARGHNKEQCQQLLKLGASDVISENVEISLELTRFILKDLKTDNLTVDNILLNFRKKYYKQMKENIKKP